MRRRVSRAEARFLHDHEGQQRSPGVAVKPRFQQQRRPGAAALATAGSRRCGGNRRFSSNAGTTLPLDPHCPPGAATRTVPSARPGRRRHRRRRLRARTTQSGAGIYCPSGLGQPGRGSWLRHGSGRRVSLSGQACPNTKSSRWTGKRALSKRIAERLFLTHRTVAAHLYQIFPSSTSRHAPTCMPPLPLLNSRRRTTPRLNPEPSRVKRSGAAQRHRIPI
jgi:hypothetical protein